MNRKLRISGRDILGYLFLGISVIMLGKSLMLCFSSDIWYDELFTVGMIEHSYGDLIAFTARDVHPPLYYCIVKFAVKLCKLVSVQTSPVMTAKIVSVLPYFVLLIYSVTFIRKRFSCLTGGLFLFCTIAMPQLSAYTVEVRMYSYALWFVTAAFLHAYGTITAGREPESADGLRADGNITGSRGAAEINEAAAVQQAKSRKVAAYARAHMRQIHAAALVCYGLAAAYTQYFACVAVIMVYLYVLVIFVVRDRGRIREWLIWTVISVVGYLPWLYVLVAQITAVNENYWILPLTWRSLGGCVKFIMKPAFTNEVLSTILAVVLFAVYVSVFVCEIAKLYHCGREKSNNPLKYEYAYRNQLAHFGFAAAGAGVLIGLVVFGFAASMLVRPIFVYRYMIPALGCFWLGFAVCVNLILDESKLCKLFAADDHDNDTNVNAGRASGAHTYGKVWQPVFAVITIGILVIGLRGYRAFAGEEEYKIRLMKETEAALSSIVSGDIVIYNFDQVQAVTSYYMDETIESYLWCGTPETLIQEIVRPYGTVELTAQIQTWVSEGRTVWFIGSFNSREDIVAEWETAGLQAEETGSYLLERYWFNLYKIY